MENASVLDGEAPQMPQKPFNQACVLQRLAFETAFRSDCLPSARAQLMRAWTDLEERKRILRMKPKPKDKDVSEKSRKPRQAPGPVLLGAPEPATAVKPTQ